MNIFSALKRTPSMKHIVYLSACVNFTSSSTLQGWIAAHGVVKSLCETALRELDSGEVHLYYLRAFTVLRE